MMERDVSDVFGGTMRANHQKMSNKDVWSQLLGSSQSTENENKSLYHLLVRTVLFLQLYIGNRFPKSHPLS